MVDKELMFQTSKNPLPDSLICFLLVTIRNVFTCSRKPNSDLKCRDSFFSLSKKSAERWLVATMGSVAHSTIWNPGSFCFSTLSLRVFAFNTCAYDLMVTRRLLQLQKECLSKKKGGKAEPVLLCPLI